MPLCDSQREHRRHSGRNGPFRRRRPPFQIPVRLHRRDHRARRQRERPSLSRTLPVAVAAPGSHESPARGEAGARPRVVQPFAKRQRVADARCARDCHRVQYRPRLAPGARRAPRRRRVAAYCRGDRPGGVPAGRAARRSAGDGGHLSLPPVQPVFRMPGPCLHRAR